MLGATAIDVIAFVWFFTCWAGYSLFADRWRRGGRSLVTVMDQYRSIWMRRMMERENRVVDTHIIGSVMRSVSLLASTSIFIVAGLIAVLGATDEARSIATTLPFTVETTAQMWEVKILSLLSIFVFAFFKFAWAMRQSNHALVVVGAAPPFDRETPAGRNAYAETAAKVVSLGFYSFNRGLRAYYFGMATLTWFIHPGLFIVASLGVVLIVYRREFRSRTLQALGDPS